MKFKDLYKVAGLWEHDTNIYILVTGEYHGYMSAGNAADEYGELEVRYFDAENVMLRREVE